MSISVSAVNNSITVVRGVATDEDKARAESIAGARYFPSQDCWTFPIDAMAAIKQTWNGAAQYDTAAKDYLAGVAPKLDALALHFARLGAPLADGRTLFAHQQAGVRWLVQRRRGILADDMGIGKTLQAIIAAKIMRDSEDVKIVLLAPVTLHRNWKREARTQGVIFNEVVSWGARKAPVVQGAYVLVVDEAHFGQSMKSARTKMFLQLATAAKAVYLLTGTPMKNGKPSNLFPLLKAVNAPITLNRSEYERKYCGAKQTRFSRWDTNGVANIDELREKCRPFILRRRKESCLDLPPKTRVFVPASVADTDASKYDVEVAAAIAEYKLHRGEFEAAQGLAVKERHAGARAKIPTAIAIAEEALEQGGQVVMFTRFIDTADEMARLLDCKVLSGAATITQRDAMVQEFQRGETKSLVITSAGGVGIDLFAAQTIVLLDRMWTPGDNEQIEDRLHRNGQKGSVICHWIQFGALDHALEESLDAKKKIIGKVVDGKDHESIYETVDTRQIIMKLAEELAG